MSYISNAKYDHYNGNDKVGVVSTEEKGCEKSFYFILNEHHTTPSDVIVFTRDAIISACILIAFMCSTVQSGAESSSKLFLQNQTWIIWGLNMGFRQRSLRLLQLLTSRKSFHLSGPIIEHNPTLSASHRWPCRSPLVSIICVISCVSPVCLQTYLLATVKIIIMLRNV